MNRFLRWIDKTRADKLAEILRPHVHGLTLDVGCWNGDVAERLGPERIVGVDVVDPPEPKIEVRRFDGRCIPFEDNSFDTVLCCTCLHHAEDPGSLIEQAKRVGNRIVVFEDAYDTTFDRMSVLLLHVISSRVINMPYRVKGFRSGKAWRRFFEEHGLKVISCVRYPGVQPLWLFLRHYLFVLEPS